MQTLQKLSTSSPLVAHGMRRLCVFRGPSAGLVHLPVMNTQDGVSTHESGDRTAPVLTLSELAVHLRVNVQTLYDLRSQGRGPRGFRVGRELRFRRSEIEAWLAGLEAADRERHPLPGERA